MPVDIIRNFTSAAMAMKDGYSHGIDVSPVVHPLAYQADNHGSEGQTEREMQTKNANSGSFFTMSNETI